MNRSPGTWACLFTLGCLFGPPFVCLGCKDEATKSTGAAPTLPSVAAASAAPSATPMTAAQSRPGWPKSDKELPTTSPAIFFGNLDGQVQVARARVEQEPKVASHHRDLAGLLYVVARQRGELDEIQAAIDEVTKAIELDPADGSFYVVRAEQEQTLHRFAAAEKDLAEAKKRGATPGEIDPVEREIAFALGRYDRAIPAIRQAAADLPNSATVARLAILEHDLGHMEAAEKAFDEAEKLVRDPSPIPVAWLEVQRGIHCMKIGDFDRAVAFLSDAVRRAPKYVLAEEHLAEALGLAGKTDEAIARYESIVARSTDPEFKGALAALYRERGDKTKADELASKAKADFEKRIKQYPEAMAAHASAFFLEEGRDPRRAAELANDDVRLRPTFAAYLSLAEAELASGHVDRAKQAIDKALATPIVSADGFWTAAEIAERKGDHAAAEAYRKRAIELNPTMKAVR